MSCQREVGNGHKTPYMGPLSMAYTIHWGYPYQYRRHSRPVRIIWQADLSPFPNNSCALPSRAPVGLFQAA